MDREIEDFIREDESQFQRDAEVVATCDNCGATIRILEEMTVFYTKASGGVRICEKCYNNMAPDEVADLLDVWNHTDNATAAEEMLTEHKSSEEASG